MNEKAFPLQHQIIDANDEHFKFGQKGMDLRDYFAAKAMHAFLSQISNYENEDRQNFYSLVPASSYQVADAMMKARGE